MSFSAVQAKSVNPVNFCVPSKEVIEAATKIQAAYRGHLVRKKDASQLSAADIKLCEDILAYRSFPSIGEAMPKAESGDTPVYFPPQAPNCILKLSGNDMARSQVKDTSSTRLEKMNYARQLCKSNQFTALLIPKAAVSRGKSVLFEQRMTFNPYHIEQERLAVVHSQAPAIRQFTKFVLLTGMWDLQIDKNYKSAHSWARFDNFPLMETKNGEQTTLQIALIDLERIETTVKKMHFQLLPKLAYVFPHSFQLIMEEAKTNGLTDEEKEKISKKLTKWHEMGLARSDHFHKSLVEYCEKKKNNVAGIQFLTPEIKKEIIDQFASEKSIKDQNIPLLVKCFELFFEAVEKALNIEDSQPSVFGEKSIYTNSAVFEWPTREAIREFEKAQNGDLSCWDDKYLRLDVEVDFFKIIEAKGIVHSAYFQGFRTFIIC
jgi:hypothetical protein